MFSIIICSASDARFTRAERHFSALFAGAAEPCEIVRIPDARSMCEGYNRGVARAKGDALAFAHDDVELLNPRAPTLLRRRLATFDALGIAGTTRLTNGAWIAAGPPHIAGQVVNPVPSAGAYNVCLFGAHARVMGGMQALDGCFFAARRDVCAAVPFDERTFDGFHGYDVDFTFSAFRAGFRLGVCADLHVLHQSTGRFDAVWKQSAERFLAKHRDALAPPPARGRHQFAVREVYSKEDAVAVMECPWWPPEDAP